MKYIDQITILQKLIAALNRDDLQNDQKTLKELSKYAEVAEIVLHTKQVNTAYKGQARQHKFFDDKEKKRYEDLPPTVTSIKEKLYETFKAANKDEFYQNTIRPLFRPDKIDQASVQAAVKDIEKLRGQLTAPKPSK